MRIMKKALVIAVVMMTVPFLALAGEAITGQKAIENVYNRPAGDDMQSDLTMTLTNSRGQSRVRKMAQFSKDFGKIEKKIMFFKYPADVRGTSFMTWSYDEAGRDDDQRIYLPALKKVKRISSDSKSDYFMGSDFTYDDLGDRHPAEDIHKLLREEMIEGESCYVVESTPREDEYIYSKTVTWIIKDKWIDLKKSFYDEDGDHLKTLMVKKYENISGFWIITHSQMNNIQKKHTTDMQLSKVKVNSGIANRQFTERMMRRGVR
ncbi:MAG: outer membrane lipoprotein-sorting protein [Deltaproteobacteria bacterium]|nr:outer membrane lipoprotein-sorting protein [Deltaproteobacteria bacterium]MBT4267219.1 outer membrane lipoprotein-sorting protein [Deltaproteobacteria bacterium]MBT4642583.1 outer membrane lipoprotein-sorting protein [Deltaproteobacteria bacterium]MBT6503073.1 outer membrane lipoprotein-sorting protein [Deltaproteobacteria bacterium]MBT6615351.1 outer membrane lipoprotein-sorting protein [Deltaproteobacteria bacterium]